MRGPFAAVYVRVSDVEKFFSPNARRYFDMEGCAKVKRGGKYGIAVKTSK